MLSSPFSPLSLISFKPVCFPWQHQMCLFPKRICDLDSLPLVWSLALAPSPGARTPGLRRPAAWLQHPLCQGLQGKGQPRMARADWRLASPPQRCLPERIAPEPLVWMGAASLLRPQLLSHTVPLAVLAEARCSPLRVSSCLLQRFHAHEHCSSGSSCSRRCSAAAAAYCVV